LIESRIHIHQQGTWQFISAALLLNVEKLHELQDDRESSLHLLTWIALRYTAHNLKPRDLSGLLEMFDETFFSDQGVNGGRIKRGHLGTQYIPTVVKFNNRPQLDKLIEELTDVFAVRYEVEPKQEVQERFRILEETNKPNDPAIADHVVPRYRKRQNDLVDSNWLVGTFRRHLADRGAWPEDDKAVPQVPDPKKPCSKRTSAEARLDSRHVKAFRMNNCSGPSSLGMIQGSEP
jgi:hypothetical protein